MNFTNNTAPEQNHTLINNHTQITHHTNSIPNNSTNHEIFKNLLSYDILCIAFIVNIFI